MSHLSFSRFLLPVLFLVAGWSQAAVPPEPVRPALRFLAKPDSSTTSQTETAADGETYSINLEPPAKIGQVYGVSARGDWTQTTSIPRAANKEKKTTTIQIRVELEARVQVTQVYPSGLPAVELYQVRRCEKFDDKGSHPVASAGSTILATTREGQPYYELDGRKVSPEILQALRAVIPVRDPLEPPADQVFGSDRPRAVGSTWGLRSTALSEAWLKRGVRLSEEALSGYTRLDQLVDFANTDCLELHCEVIYKNFVPSSTESFKVVQGSRRSSITVKVPQDGRTGPLERVTETQTQIGGRQHMPKPSEPPKPAEKKTEKKKDPKAEKPLETTLYVDTLFRHRLRQVFQYTDLEP
ncbi:MAG TPA: hypothetical protein PLA90_10900 [Candidatus Sumerlaeota bacterium]|nr:hypothetical protein [Candidatus Sumerlaeota bacterium]HPS02042.1 hypothetical protein [Candidatus Sumerlaeota bacterium]